MKKNLRESGALSPNAAVMADDGGGREMVAFDIAHQMVVHVCLPRHLVLVVVLLLLLLGGSGGEIE